jgi:hypothetical protein
MAREKTKTTVVARKLNRDCRSNAAKASTLGVKLAGSQRTRNA